MRRSGHQPAVALAASLLLFGVSGCVYGPFGPYTGPACPGACHDQGPCSPGCGNSWYDPVGIPAACDAGVGAASYSSDTSVQYGADVCACGGCEVAGGYVCPALPLVAELNGPLQSRFRPVPVRPVFSDYEPAIYPGPPLEQPFPTHQFDLPEIEIEPRPFPGAAPGELPPPAMDGPSQEPPPSTDKLTGASRRTRQRGGSWIFLPAQSSKGGSLPQDRVVSPKHEYPWY